MDILLAMKEKWLKKLLDGTKTVELRRTHPKGSAVPKYIYLYYRGMVWGKVEVHDVLYNPYSTSWLAEKTYKDACLSYQEAYDYLGGAYGSAAYYVTNPVRYKTPFPVSARPQSWQYMNDTLYEEVGER